MRRHSGPRRRQRKWLQRAQRWATATVKEQSRWYGVTQFPRHVQQRECGPSRRNHRRQLARHSLPCELGAVVSGWCKIGRAVHAAASGAAVVVAETAAGAGGAETAAGAARALGAVAALEAR